jgi:hypothetical protein
MAGNRHVDSEIYMTEDCKEAAMLDSVAKPLCHPAAATISAPERSCSVILFSACPSCLMGDLVLQKQRAAISARCASCSFAGELRSVYPPPAGRRSHTSG